MCANFLMHLRCSPFWIARRTGFELINLLRIESGTEFAVLILAAADGAGPRRVIHAVDSVRESIFDSAGS